MPFLFTLAASASTLAVAWANTLIHSGTAVTNAIDCANSVSNGIEQSEQEASPNKLCFAAGKITSQIVGIADAHADQIEPQSLPKVASLEPQVPIAH